jgi:hypothetical protein
MKKFVPNQINQRTTKNKQEDNIEPLPSAGMSRRQILSKEPSKGNLENTINHRRLREGS